MLCYYIWQWQVITGVGWESNGVIDDKNEAIRVTWAGIIDCRDWLILWDEWGYG